MPDSITVATDEVEITFDTDVKAVTTSDFDQAVQIADGIIQKTKDAQDPYIALEALRQMDRLRNLVGISKAKVLHFLNQYWEEFQIKSPFLETIMSYSGLTNSQVIKRYIQIWDMFDKNVIPQEYIDQIKSKPINDLTPIMGALSSGYEITDKDWIEIARTKGNAEISRYIREFVKEVEPNSRAIIYLLDKRDGNLFSVINGVRYVIGKIILRGHDEHAQRAIARLVENMSIQIVHEEEE